MFLPRFGAWKAPGICLFGGSFGITFLGPPNGFRTRIHIGYFLLRPSFSGWFKGNRIVFFGGEVPLTHTPFGLCFPGRWPRHSALRYPRRGHGGPAEHRRADYGAHEHARACHQRCHGLDSAGASHERRGCLVPFFIYFLFKVRGAGLAVLLGRKIELLGCCALPKIQRASRMGFQCFL